jgi:hypothetical protein
MRQLIVAAAIAAAVSLVNPAQAGTGPQGPQSAPAQGGFATQAGADWYRAQARIAAELQAEHRLALLHQSEGAAQEAALEPCINGNVSPSGAFASPELQATAESLASAETLDLLKDSAYFAAFDQGRLAD